MRHAAYSHPTRDIRLVETHISWIFLTGDFTYKLKNPNLRSEPAVSERSESKGSVFLIETQPPRQLVHFQLAVARLTADL